MLRGLRFNKSHFFYHDDLEKPNFIFSSDIPEVARTLVDRLRNTESKVVELANGHDEIKLIIELNTLIFRNKKIKPSDMIKENLIYLAKKGSHNVCQGSAALKYTDSIIPKYPRSKNLDRLQNQEEVFVVNMSLKILDFVINRETNDINIDFLKDEYYGILILSDENIVDIISKYMRCQFIKILGEASTDFKTKNLPSVISEDGRYKMEALPAIDDISLNLPSNGNNGSINDKSIILDDGDDFEWSDDLTFLKSNDTSRSTNIDSDDPSIQSQPQPKLRKSESNHANKPRNGFIKEIDNMRHNETVIDIDDLNLSDEEDHINVEKKGIKQDFSETSQTIRGSEIDKILQSAPKMSASSEDLLPELFDIPISPEKQKNTSSGSITSPTKARIVSPRTSIASFSMIDKGEHNDLDYAFRANNHEVPSYIKTDSKFKFIKIGKVQKFVDMFEDKKNESSDSTTTRSPSPLPKKFSK